MSTSTRHDAAGVTRIVVSNATAALTRLAGSTIAVTVPSDNPDADGWTVTREGTDLVITGPERPAVGGGVHSVISSGVQKGPVIQGRNISGLTFPAAGGSGCRGDCP